MYKFIRDSVKIILYIIFGLKVTGKENIPPDGSAVIASIHVSLLDPVAVAAAFRRPIHFMAKYELFKKPFLDWFFRKVNAFPVKRGIADRSAIRTALERLRSGHLLGIFPEGTRNKKDDEVMPLQSGAALFAIKTGSPIIPVVVRGTGKLRLRQPIHVVIGKPIYIEEGQKASKEELVTVNKKILEQFTFLKKQDFR